MNYFNTVRLTGYDLSVAIQKAKNQEQAVLAIMGNGKLWGPSEVHAAGRKAGMRWPITSTRRAMSVLEDAGALVKTDTMIPTAEGSIEHCWQKA